MKQIAGIAALIAFALILSGCASYKPTSQTPAQNAQTSPAPQNTAALQPSSTQQADKPNDTAADSCGSLAGKTPLVIPEAGITLPIDSSMADDLIYKVTNNPAFDPAKPTKGVLVAFSSKRLSALTKYCSFNPQYKGDMTPGVVAILKTPAPSTKSEDDYEQSHQEFFKRLGEFELAFQDSEDTCSMGKHVDLERKVRDTVLDAFKCSGLTSGQ